MTLATIGWAIVHSLWQWTLIAGVTALVLGCLPRAPACDEMVVALTNDARGYARALATLEDARSDCRLAVAARSGMLLDRIERIVGRARPALTPARGVIACAVALLMAIGLFTLALNMPPPWMPPGIRLRMPNPQLNRGLWNSP